MLALLTRRRNVTNLSPSVPVMEAKPSQPDRPDDLEIRFSTVGGSYVDVAGRTGFRGDHYRWFCHGCKAHSEFPEGSDLRSMRQAGNRHANECRAIPL
jgi:hypothetical protein